MSKTVESALPSAVVPQLRRAGQDDDFATWKVNWSFFFFDSSTRYKMISHTATKSALFHCTLSSLVLLASTILTEGTYSLIAHAHPTSTWKQPSRSRLSFPQPNYSSFDVIFFTMGVLLRHIFLTTVKHIIQPNEELSLKSDQKRLSCDACNLHCSLSTF